jgi:membrane associated rhomboid family serine protease
MKRKLKETKLMIAIRHIPIVVVAFAAVGLIYHLTGGLSLISLSGIGATIFIAAHVAAVFVVAAVGRKMVRKRRAQKRQKREGDLRPADS